MRGAPSSIGQELGWLAIFLTIFAVCVFLVLKFAVPHHFNDRIGVALCAIVAGLVMIGLRASSTRRD